MIRFAWLQARTQTVIVAAGAGGPRRRLGDHRPASGPPLRHHRRRLLGPSGDCDGATSQFLSNDTHLADLARRPGHGRARPHRHLLGCAPGRPGDSKRAPIRLAWTQSVTRTRWLVIKLALVGLASMAVAGLLSLIVTWWASPLDRAQHEPLQHFRRARHRRHRITPLFAFVARRHRRRAHPPDAPGHGHHPGRLRRGPTGRVQWAAAHTSSPRCTCPTRSPRPRPWATAAPHWRSVHPPAGQSTEHAQRLDLLHPAGRLLWPRPQRSVPEDSLPGRGRRRRRAQGRREGWGSDPRPTTPKRRPPPNKRCNSAAPRSPHSSTRWSPTSPAADTGISSGSS